MRKHDEDHEYANPFQKQDEAFQAAMRSAIAKGLESAPVPVEPEGYTIPRRIYAPLNYSAASSGARLCAETA